MLSEQQSLNVFLLNIKKKKTVTNIVDSHLLPFNYLTCLTMMEKKGNTLVGIETKFSGLP